MSEKFPPRRARPQENPPATEERIGEELAYARNWGDILSILPVYEAGKGGMMLHAKSMRNILGVLEARDTEFSAAAQTFEQDPGVSTQDKEHFKAEKLKLGRVKKQLGKLLIGSDMADAESVRQVITRIIEAEAAFTAATGVDLPAAPSIERPQSITENTTEVERVSEEASPVASAEPENSSEAFGEAAVEKASINTDQVRRAADAILERLTTNVAIVGPFETEPASLRQARGLHGTLLRNLEAYEAASDKKKKGLAQNILMQLERLHGEKSADVNEFLAHARAQTPAEKQIRKSRGVGKTATATHEKVNESLEQLEEVTGKPSSEPLVSAKIDKETGDMFERMRSVRAEADAAAEEGLDLPVPVVPLQSSVTEEKGRRSIDQLIGAVEKRNITAAEPTSDLSEETVQKAGASFDQLSSYVAETNAERQAALAAAVSRATAYQEVMDRSLAEPDEPPAGSARLRKFIGNAKRVNDGRSAPVIAGAIPVVAEAAPVVTETPVPVAEAVAPEPAETTAIAAEAAPAARTPWVETPSDTPIVMVNPTLSTQAGVKNNKAPRKGFPVAAAVVPAAPALVSSSMDFTPEKKKSNKKWYALGGVGVAAAGLLAFFGLRQGSSGPERQVPRPVTSPTPATAERAPVATPRATPRAEAATPSVEQSTVREIGVAVTAGEGADALISHLQEALRARYTDAAHAPTGVVRKVMETAPNTLSRALNFAQDGKSAVLHTGDILRISPDGSLTYVPNGNHARPIVLLSPARTTEGFKVVGTYQGQMIPNPGEYAAAQNYTVRTAPVRQTVTRATTTRRTRAVRTPATPAPVVTPSAPAATTPTTERASSARRPRVTVAPAPSAPQVVLPPAERAPAPAPARAPEPRIQSMEQYLRENPGPQPPATP